MTDPLAPLFDPSTPGNDPAINTHRRYCLKRVQQAQDFIAPEYAGVFRAKQDSAGAVLLPQDFPKLDGRPGSPILAKLNAARYTTFEDLDGSNVDELVRRAALTNQQAQAVIAGVAAIRQQRTTMGYNRGNNPPVSLQYANTLDLGFGQGPPIQSTATLTNGTPLNGPTLELGDRGTLRAVVNATVVTGGDSLAVKIQTGPDGTTWNDVASFTAVTGVGTQRKVFTGLDRFVRSVATLTGTGPTFNITGEAC